MLVFILACIASFIPSIALFLWLRNSIKDNDAYKKLCNQTLLQGAKCLLPVILLSGCSYVILRLTGLHNANPLLYQALDVVLVLFLIRFVRKAKNRKDYTEPLPEALNNTGEINQIM